jgi:hypothetical protein
MRQEIRVTTEPEVCLERVDVVALPEGERDYIKRVMADSHHSFRAKICWKNAQVLILYDDEKRLRYWEGRMDGIQHAWVTINDKVVDVTIEAAARKLKRDHDDRDRVMYAKQAWRVASGMRRQLEGGTALCICTLRTHLIRRNKLKDAANAERCLIALRVSAQRRGSNMGSGFFMELLPYRDPSVLT